jgi:hypothetical protein
MGIVQYRRIDVVVSMFRMGDGILCGVGGSNPELRTELAPRYRRELEGDNGVQSGYQKNNKKRRRRSTMRLERSRRR